MSIAIKQFCKFISIILVISLFLVLPTASILAQDYEIDMGVSREGIWFSPTQFFAGDSVKIYARIENYGSEDITGQVTFFQGVNQIGKPKSVSIVSGGQAEEIWTNEWIAPEGRVNIKVAVVDAEPMDENWDNNEAISTTFDVQKDTDGDNIGDDEDLDDDGDMMPDEWEEEHNFDPLDLTDAQEDADSDNMINVDEYNSGTDPHNSDTDGDGVIDELAINTIDEVDESTSFLADDDYEMDIKKIVIFGLAGLIAFVLLGLFIKELVRK